MPIQPATGDSFHCDASETVIVIHGTGAAPFPDRKEPRWWQAGGAFCQQLDHLLVTAGSRARCWSHINGYPPVDGHPPHLKEFHWSGRNSEVARREAASELRSYLKEIEGTEWITRYHLVAHSHGGNVISYALDRLGFKPQKLGTIVFLGTPFFHCLSKSTIFSGWRLLVGLLILLVSLAALPVYTILYFPAQGRLPMLLFLMIFIEFPLVAMVVLSFQQREISWIKTLPDDSQAYSVLFAHDEAFRVLTECIRIRAHPKPLARLIVGGSLTPRFCCWSSIHNSMFPTGENPARFLSVLVGRWPFRTKRRAEIDSPLTAAGVTVGLVVLLILIGWALDFVYIDENTTTITKVACVLLILYPFMRLIDFLIGWFYWISNASTRLGLVMGLAAAANTGLGNDMPSTAIQRVETRPQFGKVEVIKLPADLEEEAISRVCEDTSRTVRRLYEAINQVDLLGPNVTQILSDASLVHAQYYQTLRSISIITDCLLGQTFNDS
jgi:hypothetical protein